MLENRLSKRTNSKYCNYKQETKVFFLEVEKKHEISNNITLVNAHDSKTHDFQDISYFSSLILYFKNSNTLSSMIASPTITL